MSNQPTIELLISDLKKVRETCNRKSQDEIPEVAIQYLFVNRHLIEFYLKQLYSKTDKTQRSKLFEEHRELDHSAIDDGWYSIAEMAIRLAEDTVKYPSAASFFKITDDKIMCLLRGLEYAKYYPFEFQDNVLRMSPIDQYGLKHYGDKRYHLTNQEIQALNIPWHISDILYFEKKKETVEECKRLGLDLENLRVDFFPDGDEAAVRKWTEMICKTLYSKLESDLAVIYSSSPKSVEKCTNTILERLWHEYIYFINGIRNSLKNFLTIRCPDVSENTIWNRIQNQLKPLLDYNELAYDKILNVRPSPAVFGRVRELIGRDNSFNIGEITMRDKYTIGQSGAVGPDSHAHDMNFSQIWYQTSSDIDLSKLAQDLSKLRGALVKEASEPEQYVAIGDVASAELEAKKQDGPKAMEYLSKAGKWALDIATKIGAAVAESAIKKAMGMG